MDNQLEMGHDDLKAVLECMLFASGEPLSRRKLSEVLGVKGRTLEIVIDLLKTDYSDPGRGLTIIDEDGSLRIATKRSLSTYLDKLFSNTRKKGLSNAALEVLAIIALRQPATKSTVEDLRGCNCDGAIQTLLKRELIESSGKSNKIGSPQLYVTTKKFLVTFELESLDDLPNPEELILI